MAIKFTELIAQINKQHDIFIQLKKAINDEFLAFLQYSSGIGTCHCEKVKASFKEKANDEFKHALMFYEILQELGGEYIFMPQHLLFGGDCPFSPQIGDSINKITSNIKGEQCAIASYSTMLKLCDFNDKHTKIIKSIIAEEEVHVDELVKLLKEKKKEYNK
jgi:bacterioferritin